MAVLYVITAGAIWILFRLVSNIIDRVKLKEFDRQLGATFGLAKGVLYCVVITFFAVTLSESSRQVVLASRSGDLIARGIRNANPILPEDVRKYLGEYIDELDKGCTLRRRIRPHKPRGRTANPQSPPQEAPKRRRSLSPPLPRAGGRPASSERCCWENRHRPIGFGKFSRRCRSIRLAAAGRRGGAEFAAASAGSPRKTTAAISAMFMGEKRGQRIERLPVFPANLRFPTEHKKHYRTLQRPENGRSATAVATVSKLRAPRREARKPQLPKSTSHGTPRVAARRRSRRPMPPAVTDLTDRPESVGIAFFSRSIPAAVTFVLPMRQAVELLHARPVDPSRHR